MITQTIHISNFIKAQEIENKFLKKERFLCKRI